jgi:hypothetical protein
VSLRLIVPFALGLLALPLWSQILVDTFAGGKVRTGVPANDVALSSIDGLAWDRSGGLVFCETSANLIRRIRSDGTIETVAGTGVTGFSGDGGPALNATLHSPAKPRFDSSGNLYFADTLNNRIRRIDTRGVITSVAGSGVPFSTGLDLEGPALERSLGGIGDLAVGADGSVYFTDTDDFVRRVTPGGRIEIFAGVSRADCPNCSDGDNGPASAAHIAYPRLLAFDGAGNLYLADNATPNRIRRIAPDGTITKFAGYGSFTGVAVNDDGAPALDAYLYQVSSMTADNAGNVYIVQQSVPVLKNPIPTRIRRIDASGIITTVAVSSSNGLAVDEQGNIAFSDFTSVHELIPGSNAENAGGRQSEARARWHAGS